MKWSVKFLPEADKDLDRLTRKQQITVKKAIDKVQTNPLSQNDGGYGKPLGHRQGTDLTNLLKTKLAGEGLRIVYRLIRAETAMLIVVIVIREDEEVYRIARQRADRHAL